MATLVRTPTRPRARGHRIPASAPVPARALAAAGIVFAVAALALTAQPARAGTICGVVRDAASGGPVAHAGVFVRDAAGAYTGLYTSTEPNGSFCVYFVPPGTYTLEIRVDDYAVAYVNDVVVTGAVTDVPVSIANGGLSLARPWPSPASRSLHIAWSMPRGGPARLAVFDIHGRLRIAWSTPDVTAGTRVYEWDLRDERGVRLPAGVYYLRLESDGARRVRRFVCLP